MYALSRISQRFVNRNIFTKSIRHGSDLGGIPGENLPFSIHSRARVTFTFLWFIGSGIAAPFLVVAYQIKKNN